MRGCGRVATDPKLSKVVEQPCRRFLRVTSLPATICEGVGQCALGNCVTAASARKDRHRRNPGRKIVVTAALNSKDGAGACHTFGQSPAEALVRRHWQD